MLCGKPYYLLMPSNSCYGYSCLPCRLAAFVNVRVEYDSIGGILRNRSVWVWSVTLYICSKNSSPDFSDSSRTFISLLIVQVITLNNKEIDESEK